MNTTKPLDRNQRCKALYAKPDALSTELWLHGGRVAAYAMLLLDCACQHGLFGEAVQLNGRKRAHLALAMRYHDVGKIATPAHVLHKAGKLDGDEWKLMRQHPQDGVRLFRGMHSGNADRDTLRLYQNVILQHHERWDGEGYPQRLKGADISLWARLCAVADTYDAITHSRVYHRAESHERACQVIMAQAGKQFDPLWVRAFRLCRQQLAAFQERLQTA